MPSSGHEPNEQRGTLAQFAAFAQLFLPIFPRGGQTQAIIQPIVEGQDKCTGGPACAEPLAHMSELMPARHSERRQSS